MQFNTGKPAFKKIKHSQEFLFNIVSTCLLNENQYYNTSDQKTKLIIEALVEIAEFDPEFILQLALYLRKYLLIRTTSNFILGFASAHDKTKCFVEKYIPVSVNLPTDLLEICQYTQLCLYFKESNFQNLQIPENIDFSSKLKFPKALQRAVKKTFHNFSIYQLGKYCSESRRKKTELQYDQIIHPESYVKPQKQKKNSNLPQKSLHRISMIHMINHRAPILTGPPVPPQPCEAKYISMKDLIRFCHVSEPQLPVMSVLGKKYPATQQEFDMMFNKELEKERNEKIVNENDSDDDEVDLQVEEIQKSEMITGLAFDAMQAGKRMRIPIPDTWETQISVQGNKPEIWTALITQQKLPYMAMIRNLRNIIISGVSEEVHSLVIKNIQNPQSITNGKIFPLQYFGAMSEINNAMTQGLIVKQKDEQTGKNSQTQTDNIQLNPEIGKRYIESIQRAIMISCEQNIKPLQGHTAIFADVSGSMCTSISGGQKYGSIRQCKELALLLGLMIKSRTEKCSFFIFSSGHPCFIQVKELTGSLFENMKILQLEARKLGGGTDFPVEVVENWIKEKIIVDNSIILSDMMISEGYGGIETSNQVMRRYIDSVNQDLKVFSIDLAGYGNRLNMEGEFEEKNFIRIFGMSDSVLRYINLIEGCSQIQDIENFASETFSKKKL